MRSTRFAARAAALAAFAATLLLVHRSQARDSVGPDDAPETQGTDEDTADVAESEATEGKTSGLEGTESPAEGSESGDSEVEQEAETELETTDQIEDETEGIEEIEDVEVVEEAAAVETKSRYHGMGSPRTERGVNVALARPTRAKSLLLIIDHRAGQTFLQDAWTDYLGLDAGALKIGLGLRYGIIDDLDVGLYRLNNTIEIFDVYDFDTRWRFLNQADHHLDVALRADVTWFVQPDMGDAVGFGGQLLADRVFLDQLLVATGFLFHSDSSNDRKSLDDDAYSGALALLLEWRFIDLLALNAEAAANVFGYGSKWPAFAFAFEVVTYRHTFALVFSNTQYVTSDGIVAGSWRGFDELVFGFQITREINF